MGLGKERKGTLECWWVRWIGSGVSECVRSQQATSGKVGFGFGSWTRILIDDAILW